LACTALLVRLVFPLALLLLPALALPATVAVLGSASPASALDALARQLGGRRVAQDDTWWLRLPGGRLQFAAVQPSAPLTEVADLASQADAVLITVDTAEGPTRALRDHILVARQAGITQVAVLLIRSDLFQGEAQGASLTGKIAAEVRSTLDTYDLGGKDVPVFADSDAFPEIARAQLAELARWCERGHRTVDPGARAPTQQTDVLLYLLTQSEQPGAPAEIREGAELDIWIGGHSVSAVVRSPAPLQPGKSEQIALQLDHAVPIRAGDRLFVHLANLVTAVGMVSEVPAAPAAP
jgi:translation elongation factor EF-Tu-like GTPase